GKESEAIGKPAIGIRFGDEGDHYSLSDGERAFRVVPEENLASPVPPTTSDELLACHLLARFLKSETKNEFFKAAEPAEPGEEGEKKPKSQLVYFCSTTLGDESIDMQWIVNAATQLPKSVEFLRTVRGKSIPFATLFVEAVNEPVDDDQIKVSDSLTEDGRIGKFVDVQGFVSLRPKAITRWTPICGPGSILKPGDWVRTDIRGANAVAVQLVPETKLILGPGSLVELLTPMQIKVLSGEFEVFAPVKHPVELTGPDGTKIMVMGPEIFRVQGEKLVKLAKEPLWLAGFKGTTPQETLGSLIAKVDGRNVPLHVGYHKVSVEIRDQIARTTIEESFVNSTNAVLEGQFHFPLPADASISGFGMWVGDRLVEADIVEKQRAREIYETILREKRDPGLLEWSGGNIFKARVYPIPARSEKRIKIVYTQVLPREGNSYRYSYALQSELLRQHPVRELNLTVTVSSAVKIASISCPTHPARFQKTEHSARAEFSAQEYAPTRDFEVVVQVEDDKQGVVMIPHRRGDDGYFLLLLSPPSDNGLWRRDVVPDGEPLKLIVLADTSASMDRASRKTQDEVLGALLGTLGPKDSFQLAVCDVDCIWASDKPQVADGKTIEAARNFLAKRRSMGWTDLDKAFAEALKRADGKTHVVYLGDGVVTTGDADGQAFAKRLVKMAEGKPATFHSIAVSSSFEAPVMKAIGSVGGGSVRNVSGEKGPQQTAKDLLAEIARPSLKNVSLKFPGLRTARVYPAMLTNLPLGSQQIILGRYLPEGKDQKGEVVVTGTLAGKEVSYRAAVGLKDAESGNSFIPRLWARMHLDELLAQGTSQAVQDEIINLSEEYHLMTPYTSLLVLESDADRERFKVKRRFQMRDGERFFADAKDKAQYELVQQQMRIAATWRLQLRNRVLAELAHLGRNAQYFEQRRQRLSETREMLGVHGFLGRSSGTTWANVSAGSGMGGDVDNYFLGDESELATVVLSDSLESSSLAFDAEFRFGVPSRHAVNDLAPLSLSPEMPGMPGMPGLEAAMQYEDSDGLAGESKPRLLAVDGGDSFGFGVMYKARYNGRRLRSSELFDGTSFEFIRGFGEGIDKSGYFAEVRSFPQFLPLHLSRPLHKSKPAAELLSKHTPEVRDLVLALQRGDKVRALPGGVEFSRATESFDARFGELIAKSNSRDLLSGSLGWLSSYGSEGSSDTVDWCDAKERGIWSPAYELALVRKAIKEEHLRWKGSAEDYPLVEALRYANPAKVTLEHPAENQVLLILGNEFDEDEESELQTRFLIDTKRNVLLSVEERVGGKTTRTVKFADFVELAGRFWPQTQETLDADGKRISLTKNTVKVLSAEQFTGELKAQQTAREPSLTLHLPLPTHAEAKKALVRLGEITPEVYLRLLIGAASKQDWEKTHEYLARIEEQTKEKAWPHWLRLHVLSLSRRHEELKTELMKMGTELADKPHVGEWTLESALWQYGESYLGQQEQLELLAALRPIFARAPEYLGRIKQFDETRLQLLIRSGRTQEANALRKNLAERYPRDLGLQTQYANWLGQQGDQPAAYAWLTKTMGGANSKWTPGEIEQLQWSYLSLLENQGRYADKAEYLAPILAKNPRDERFYSQYLVALILTSREAEADKLIKEWLAADLAGKEKDAARARASAAVQIVMNETHPFGSRQYDVAWLKPLAEFALRNAAIANYTARNSVRSVLQNSEFSSSDEMPKLSKALMARLLAEAEKLTPGQLESLVEHTRNAGHYDTEQEWQRVAKIVQARWEKEKPGSRRELKLDEVLRNIHQETGEEARTAYLRLRIKLADDESRPDKQRQLFDELISHSWTPEMQAETLTLLDKLGSGPSAEGRLVEQLSHLYRWTDRMQEARRTLLESKVEKRDEMTRQDLATKLKGIAKQVGTELAQSLSTAATDRKDPLSHWLVLESLHLQTQQEIDLPKVTETAWKLLEETLVSEAKQNVDRQKLEESEDEENVQGLRDMLLLSQQSRLVSILVHLAIRKDARPKDLERLLKLCDERMVFADKTKDDDDAPPRLDWRQVKYNLLVALDRPKDLAAELAKWAAADTANHRWKKSLAYLNAELGKLDDAIKFLEGLETSGELAAADYRALATWYQATKQDAKNAQAKVSLYKTLDEYHLRQMLYSRAENASDVTPDDLLAYQAYFAKASSPHEALGAVEKHYRTTQDFRLLAGLADAVIGHTSGKIYPFIGQLDSVLDEIKGEPTVDELAKHIGEVRAKTKSVVDLRALDLLEMLVERRAAQVQNQPGPHIALAVAALQRAEKREWAIGEPLQFAQMLANISFTEQPALAADQLRIMVALHAAAKQGSLERLEMAGLIATIHTRHERHEQAIDILTAACDEFREAQGGKSTTELRQHLIHLVGMLEQRGRYAAGERIFLADMARADFPHNAYWLRLRLNDLYAAALRHGGDTSLGKGAALFAANQKQLLVLLLETKDQQERLAYHGQLCELFMAAHQAKIPSAGKELAEYVSKTFPDLAKKQISNYRNMVTSLAVTIRTVQGPREMLAFYIDRMEREPAWLLRTGEDGWSQYHNELAQLRKEVPKLGDLELPLLAIVITELKRDMRTHTSRDRQMYSDDFTNFWKEKAADFAKAAEEVLAENKDKSASIHYIANYLINGLSLADRGIEVLFDAHRRELLDDSGKQLLISTLFQKERHGEAIALLEALVRKQPKAFGWRTQLMHAYFKTRQPQALRKMLAETDKLFIAPYPNDESNLAAMGRSTLENELYEEAVKYFERAVKVRTDLLKNRTQGDGTLAGYFQYQAKAYAGLGKTAEAVDKASAAIVIWPSRHDQRQEAINLLRSMLNQSPNLDAYVAVLDTEVEKDQQERPIIRQQIGIVYQEKFMAWDKAIKQFRLAIELVPEDTNLHQRLIACLDAKGDAAGALAQSLESLELSRRNLDLWNKLA
ncbi:MAG: hypothetical protein K8R36_08335, partial [Planctomycetales bacterium]|nr:hypothetical protein [Planctomycetales bacterium]